MLLKKKKIPKCIIDDIEFLLILMKKVLVEKILMRIFSNLIFEAYKKYFYIFLYTCMKMVKKYKEKLQKEACERYQNLSEEEKEKSVSIIVIKLIIFLKKKNKRKLSI